VGVGWDMVSVNLSQVDVNVNTMSFALTKR
jgi:hypothetical protein